ncbi:ATP-binding protein [Enterovirga sp. CN4-39]|uniref:ATP-binding protein n=1 Tax=Enterovirga sp. CN4-39 TaxID=3400910 RepID=UPI003C031102
MQEVVEFGGFRLLLGARQLLKDGHPVAMGGRALELLIALLERHGDVVSREELLARAWPNLFVEEANLRVQMAALRRVLGDGQDNQRYIVNVARRGYCFVGEVRLTEAPAHEGPSPDVTQARRQNLPNALVSVFGREAAVAAIGASLSKSRLVTIVGSGGVGKTTTALQAARSYLDQYDSIILVELAQISEPVRVESSTAAAISMTLGIEQQPLLHVPPLGRSLVILDNCEHVAEAAAQVAETLLLNSPELKILATSREPLRAAGEVVSRLSGLELPPHGAATLDALDFPAIRLFVERAADLLGSYSPTPEDLPAIVALCRRLDGIPLAIELAAGRVDTFGVPGLIQQLDDVFRLLVSGRRTALPRHRTLHATLNWSYNQLSPAEQTTLSRLSIFSGLFSLDAASSVASIEEPSWSTIDDLTNLVSKSLISVEFSQALPRYRLLDTTRTYAREKLRKSGEHDRLSRRHAAHLKEQMSAAERDLPQMTEPAWMSTYAPHVDDLRAALAWCFGPTGDAELGTELAVASSVLWFQLSLVSEGRRYFEHALAALEGHRRADPAREIALLSSLGTALIYTTGPGPEIDRLWERAATIAKEAKVVDLELEVLSGAWLSELTSGRYPSSLATAEAFRHLAVATTGDAAAATVRIAERLIGVSQFFLGHVVEARQQFETVIESRAAALSPLVRMQYDQGLNARAYLSMVLWLLGSSEAAQDSATRCVADAQERGHATSLSLVLVEAGCPVPFYGGDLDTMEARVGMLQDISRRHPFGPWRAWGRCFRGSLLFGRGDFGRAVEHLSGGLDELARTRWPVRRALFLCHLAQALDAEGNPARAGAPIEEALSLCAATGEGWLLPELLRVQAVLLARESREQALTTLARAQSYAEGRRMTSWLARCAETERYLAPSTLPGPIHL